MKSLLVNWLFIYFIFSDKHLECSRTLKAYDRIFIELSLTFHTSVIGEISPVT